MVQADAHSRALGRLMAWQQRFLDKGVDGSTKCCMDLKEVYGVNGVGWEAQNTKGGES